MLTEERYNKILEALKNKGTITVAEMTECTGASESTIRRDLIALPAQLILCPASPRTKPAKHIPTH